MADVFTKAKRSDVMSRIRSKNTKPERVVRSALRALGYPFRLHSKNVEGNPDIVLRNRPTAIFVHGCFWHRHRGCKFAYSPKSRVKFWQTKFASNVARDKAVRRNLRRNGWQVITVWECRTRDIVRLARFLEDKIGLISMRQRSAKS